MGRCEWWEKHRIHEKWAAAVRMSQCRERNDYLTFLGPLLFALGCHPRRTMEPPAG